MRLSLFHVVAVLGLTAVGEAKKKPCACNNAALEHCLKTHGVAFKVKCDADWEIYSTPLNLRVPVNQAVIALPNDSKQVSAAVVCARKNGLKAQAKSGGHSYGGYSNVGIDGQVEIDLRNLNTTVLTSDGSVAVVGGGVKLGPMATAIYAQGKRAIPHGICGGVGIGGHSTHGGWGFTSRAWGLTLDHIVEMQVVLANGTEARASPTVNADLYWALRGAADSLAIVTSFSLSTVPAPEEVVNFNYEVRDVLKSVDQAVSAFAHLQSFISNATTVDRRTSFSLQTHYGPDRATGEIIKTFLIQGTFLGSLAEYKSSIEPEMLRGIPAPTASDVQAKDWIASLTALSPDGRLTGEALYLAFFANSVTIDDPGMNEAALRSYFTYMLEGPPSPGVAYQSNMELWGGADTQINLPAKDTKFAAFPHRNIFWTAHNLAQAAPNTTFPAEGIAWLNGLRQAILKDLDVPSAGYLNLLDTSLTRDEAHALYYGDEVLGRLKGIKAQYDKKDVFWNPQSI